MGGRTARRSPAVWLVVLLAVLVLTLGEIVSTLAVLAPWRVEHRFWTGGARLARVLLTDRTVVLPGGFSLGDAGPDAVFPRAIADAETGNTSDAEQMFSATTLIPTWGAHRLPSIVTHDDLPRWLASFGPRLRIYGTWSVQFAGEQWEVSAGTSNLNQNWGLSVDALYGVAIRQGHIDSVAVVILPASRVRLTDALAYRGLMRWHPLSGWLVLAPALLLVAAATFVLFRGSRRRWLVVALLVLWPTLTILAFTVSDPIGSELGTALPDRPLYLGHAALALTLERVHAPRSADLQWSKALSHARSADEIAFARAGEVRDH